MEEYYQNFCKLGSLIQNCTSQARGFYFHVRPCDFLIYDSFQTSTAPKKCTAPKISGFWHSVFEVEKESSQEQNAKDRKSVV